MVKQMAGGDDGVVPSRPGRTLPLVGRDAELEAVQALLDGARQAATSLLVLGDAGIGKSTLIDVAVARAEVSGFRVLRSRGGRSEADLPFAGLHQLLDPVLDRADELSDVQRSALLVALGVVPGGATPDPLRLGVAVLSLLSSLAADEPLLLVLDDCHWTDAASLGTLAFAVRRIREEPVGLLAGGPESGCSTCCPTRREGAPGTPC